MIKFKTFLHEILDTDSKKAKYFNSAKKSLSKAYNDQAYLDHEKLMYKTDKDQYGDNHPEVKKAQLSIDTTINKRKRGLSRLGRKHLKNISSKT